MNKEKNIGIFQSGKFLVISFLFLFLVACSSKEDSMTTSSGTGYELATEEAERSETQVEYSTDEASPSAIASGAEADVSKIENQRKYIRKFWIELETLEFEEAENNLYTLVEQYGGYLESTQVSGRSIDVSYYQRRNGSYAIRIPSTELDSFVSGLSGIGNKVDENSQKEDVTSSYTDLEARLKTLGLQEERLLSILETADELQYIIELERELADVRYEIESYTSTFRNLENQISYATVYVNLQEVIKQTVIKEEPKTFFGKMSEGFLESIQNVFYFIQDLVLFLVISSPQLILVGLFAYFIYRFIRRIRKKKRTESNIKNEKSKEDEKP
jgi:hypothetical protein